MAQATVLGDLKRTYRYQGKYYGPGINVKIPAGLAATLGIQPKSEAPKSEAPKKAVAPKSSDKQPGQEPGSTTPPAGDTDPGSES